MFELGRELMRLLGGRSERSLASGLAGGDRALLELLDLPLLLQEGRTVEQLAGELGARERPARRLQGAIVWREVARRTGDVVHLRKAASMAEAAASLSERSRRGELWARARVEQGFCALAGAELFGDAGLDAAAAMALREARAATHDGLTAALAELGLAAVAGREALTGAGDAAQARERFAPAIAALDALSRRSCDARVWAAEARLMRADLLCGLGGRAKDELLLKAAVEDAAAAARQLDADYEPLSFARAEVLRGQALTRWGELAGDVEAVANAATILADALALLTRDHSPLDWARAQLALAETLQVLADAADDAHAFEQAVTCYDRANLVLRGVPAMPLRGVAARARAACLARLAEVTGDIAVLDAAEAAMKMELAAQPARRDPVSWAVAQLHLASLYAARLDLTGVDRGQRAAALLALEAAFDVFAEEGLSTLANLANEALERLRTAAVDEARRV